jgi:PleD family two-component response regulator
VSTGIAVYPRDGKTIAELLGAADHVLYRKKASSKRKLPQPT